MRQILWTALLVLAGADSTLALMPHLLHQRGEIVRPCGAEVGGRDYLNRVPAITWPGFRLHPAG